MAKTISIINGPNLNLLGAREPEVYGKETLDDIIKRVSSHAKAGGFAISDFQSNNEGEIVDAIQNLPKDCCGLIINPAAYTHTSVAIRDAIAALSVPVVEVHISNVFSREEFRSHSYISPVASGVISGFGSNGYILAVDALIGLVK